MSETELIISSKDNIQSLAMQLPQRRSKRLTCKILSHRIEHLSSNTANSDSVYPVSVASKSEKMNMTSNEPNGQKCTDVIQHLKTSYSSTNGDEEFDNIDYNLIHKFFYDHSNSTEIIAISNALSEPVDSKLLSEICFGLPYSSQINDFHEYLNEHSNHAVRNSHLRTSVSLSLNELIGIANTSNVELNVIDPVNPLDVAEFQFQSRREHHIETQARRTSGKYRQALTEANNSQVQLVKKLCKICKRKATGRHYGVESCEACKCFFRRVAKSRVKYYCQNGGSCKIDLDKRSSCQACRFNLCIDAGMTFLRK